MGLPRSGNRSVKTEVLIIFEFRLSSFELRISIFGFRISILGPKSVFDEGLEPFLCELRPHLFRVIPRGEGAYLNPVQVVISVRVFGGNEKNRVAAPFQDIHKSFGIFLCPRSRNLDRESDANFPSRGRKSCGRGGFLRPFGLRGRGVRRRHMRLCSSRRHRFLLARR